MPNTKWFDKVKRKFLRLTPDRINTVVVQNTAYAELGAEVGDDQDDNFDPVDGSHLLALMNPDDKKCGSREDEAAAIIIQAVFRGHLARRAFRALKSLVKLQALARGVYVRKQTQVALHCMHALVRLHVKVRARQLIDASAEVINLKKNENLG